MLLALMSTLPIVATSLRFAGYVRTRRWLERISRHPQPHVASEAELAAAERLAELASIAGRRGLISATCLRQSLLVYALLRRRGLQPELKIGVRKQGGEMDAHAWVAVGAISLGAFATHRNSAWQPA